MIDALLIETFFLDKPAKAFEDEDASKTDRDICVLSGCRSQSLSLNNFAVGLISNKKCNFQFSSSTSN